MIPPLRFTPSWLADQPDKTRPAFLLRAGSILERDQFEAELDGRHRAGLVLGFQLLEAAVAGVQALVPGDDAAELEELLRSDFGGADLSPLEKARLKELGDILARSWPDFAACKEQESRRNAILPTLAFATWCCGWENVADADGKPVEYAREADGTFADDLLRRVPFTLLRVAGTEAYAIQYGKTQAKN